MELLPATAHFIPAKMEANPMDDTVNRPPHYNAGQIECIDAIESAVTGLSGIEAVCTANAIKYLWRWPRKGYVEDLKKAEWYIEKLISVLERDSVEKH